MGIFLIELSLLIEEWGRVDGRIDNNFRQCGISVTGDILLEIRYFFIEFGDDSSFKSIALHFAWEIDEVIHDIIMISIYMNSFNSLAGWEVHR